MKWFVLSFFGLLIILLVADIRRKSRARSLLHTWPAVRAVVRGWSTGEGAPEPKVSYEFRGAQYEVDATVLVTAPDVRVGDTITIHVDPDRPRTPYIGTDYEDEIVRVPRKPTNWKALGIVAIAMLVFGISVLFSGLLATE